MKILDADTTRTLLPFERLIPAIEAMFARDDCEVPRRHVHEIPCPGERPVTSLIMPAWLPGRYYGIKTVNIAPGNAARGLPGLHSTYVLYDAATGAPLAQLDGDQITSRRTAAASALAAARLARPDAARLLVVGAGQVARLLPEAYRALLPIGQVAVWARQPRQARRLAQELGAIGIDAQAADDLEAATRAADIVSCATLATEPVVLGRWLAPGSHLDLIGSFTPAMREADDDCFANARLWVDTDEALAKSGELLGPIARGVLSAADVQGTLAGLSRGTAPRRESAHERTVFKSVGTALEDLAAAVLAFESSSAGGSR